MNTYNFYDEDFQKTDIYKSFLEQNQALGTLKVRAYAASQAIPIAGLKVVISTMFGNDKIVFYDGVTDESGVTEEVSLPVPKLEDSNLVAPLTRVYEVDTTYEPNNLKEKFLVNIYEDICVVQNISIVPQLNRRSRWL